MVYEPRETIRLTNISLENVGGMPTPAHADIHLSIRQQGWVNSDESKHLLLPRSIGLGESVTLEGSLPFEVTEFRPREAAAPLEIGETIQPRARVVSVRRDFQNFQVGEALALGEFLIRFPVRVSDVSSLRSLALVLGDIKEPDSLRTIQLRDFTTRIANRYRMDLAANLLLVVNHNTTATELAAWRTLAAKLGFIISLWDLTLERHLDLRADLGHGRCLIDHFAGGTIAILNNSIESRSNPHQFLSKADLYAANSEAIHIAFVGADPSLEQLLMPALTETVEPIVADSPEELVTSLATVPERALMVADGKVEFHDREWGSACPTSPTFQNKQLMFKMTSSRRTPISAMSSSTILSPRSPRGFSGSRSGGWATSKSNRLSIRSPARWFTQRLSN